jgi:alpha-beta hydrolase superfamily lysophospholipase
MEDPLVHQKVSARWFTEILSAMNEVDTIARSLKIPLLLLHGTEDGLTDPEGSKRFFSLLPHTPHQEIHLIEGGYHELFHELLEYREKSYRIVEEWIRKVEKAPSTG